MSTVEVLLAACALLAALIGVCEVWTWKLRAREWQRTAKITATLCERVIALHAPDDDELLEARAELQRVREGARPRGGGVVSGFGGQKAHASPSAIEYTIERLLAEGVSTERIERVTGAMEDGYEWHPRSPGELRAALAIAKAKMEGRDPSAIEALPYVGPMLREDCV